MAKKVTVKVSYGWAGIPTEVSEFITSTADGNEIEEEASEYAEELISRHVSWDYEVEDIEDGNE